MCELQVSKVSGEAVLWHKEQITTLQPNEVFVFGSNKTGFHGAGAAGLACRGDARNTWREDEWFLKAMKSPVGSPDRIGKWAVYGIAKGYQRGREGVSFAVQTIEHPGLKRSVSRQEIYKQLQALWSDADKTFGFWKFLVTPLAEGLAGYTREEMAEVWDKLITEHGLPPNIRFVRS